MVLKFFGISNFELSGVYCIIKDKLLILRVREGEILAVKSYISTRSLDV